MPAQLHKQRIVIENQEANLGAAYEYTAKSKLGIATRKSSIDYRFFLMWQYKTDHDIYTSFHTTMETVDKAYHALDSKPVIRHVGLPKKRTLEHLYRCKSRKFKKKIAKWSSRNITHIIICADGGITLHGNIEGANQKAANINEDQHEIIPVKPEPHNPFNCAVCEKKLAKEEHHQALFEEQVNADRTLVNESLAKLEQLFSRATQPTREYNLAKQYFLDACMTRLQEER